ncbi:MAG: winged helix-turn-helix transcriptional regulator [Promethearchaeota archaeon]
MVGNNISKWKQHRLRIFILCIIFFEFTIVLGDVFGRTENISGFWTEDLIEPNEFVSYHFPNNIIFEISSNSSIDLYLEYENRIANRQSFFILNKSESISLNITTKTSMGNFGILQPPNAPKRGSFQSRYQYNCIFKIRTNSSIENLVIRHRKNSQFGLNSNINYSLALFDISQESWELIDTQEKFNSSVSELYLESSFAGLESNTDYYITIFEFTEEPSDWTWLISIILISAVSILSIAFLISKKDYFQYLKTRIVSIEKGAHRLTLEEVLENENRNKVIDLVLNEPGIHFNELLRRTGLAAGNLVWHLDILMTYKVIGKKRIGNTIAYFPYYQKNPISNIDLQLQKSKLTLEILEMIEKDPGIWNNLITKKLKVDHKTILYHIKKLIELDLLNIKKEGRKNKLFPNFDSEYFQFKNKSNKKNSEELD